MAVSVWIANKSSKLPSRRRHVQTCWPNSNRFALTNRNVCFEYSWNVTYRDNELSYSSTEHIGIYVVILFHFSQSSFLRSVSWMCVLLFSFSMRNKRNEQKNYWICSFPLQQRKFTIQISVFWRTRKSNKIHVHISSSFSLVLYQLAEPYHANEIHITFPNTNY